MMQVITSGYFTNTDKEHKLLIMSAYLEGTKPVLGFMEPIEIGPEECAQERIDAYVEPVVGKKGERYKGKIIWWISSGANINSRLNWDARKDVYFAPP